MHVAEDIDASLPDTLLAALDRIEDVDKFRLLLLCEADFWLCGANPGISQLDHRSLAIGEATPQKVCAGFAGSLPEGMAMKASIGQAQQ